MAGSGSDWRTSDVVAYDVMRDLARSVISVLVQRASRDGNADAGDAARALHSRVMQVDGRDRAALDAVTDELLAQWSELQEASDG